MKQQLLLVVSALILIAHSVFARAPIARPASDADLLDSNILSAKSSFSYAFSSDFEDGSLGSVESFHFDNSLVVPIPMGESFRLLTGVNYERMDFSSDASFVPDHMQSIAGIAGIEYLIRGKPAVFLRTSPGYYFLDSPDSDSFDIPAVLYAAFKLAPSFTGIVGATYTGFRDDYPVLPLVGFIWNVTDKVKVKAILPVASVDYEVNELVTVSLIGQYVGMNVHTADDLNTPVYNHTELSYSEMRAGAAVSFKIFEESQLRISGGWAFWQEFHFTTPDDDYKTDGAPFAGISLNVKF